MFKALCRGVRNHTVLWFVIFTTLSSSIFASILRIVGKYYLMSDGEILAIMACATLLLFIGSAYLCSFLTHYAYAMDHMKEHPLVDVKEAWNKTKKYCAAGLDEEF